MDDPIFRPNCGPQSYAVVHHHPYGKKYRFNPILKWSISLLSPLLYTLLSSSSDPSEQTFLYLLGYPENEKIDYVCMRGGSPNNDVIECKILHGFLHIFFEIFQKASDFQWFLSKSPNFTWATWATWAPDYAPVPQLLVRFVVDFLQPFDLFWVEKHVRMAKKNFFWKKNGQKWPPEWKLDLRKV